METIVVGAAETETSGRAVERAARLAVALDARLIVVTAYEGDDLEVVGVGSDSFEVGGPVTASTFAERTAARLSATYGIEVSAVAASGKPAARILEVAEANDATLIVVGNVRMQGPGRVFGSVANDISHRAPCDVVIVKTV